MKYRGIKIGEFNRLNIQGEKCYSIENIFPPTVFKKPSSDFQSLFLTNLKSFELWIFFWNDAYKIDIFFNL